jgi:alpha-L-arabinofuranosidase
MAFRPRRRRLRHGRALCASAGAILAVAAATAAAAPAGADTLPVPLSDAPLGLNTAPWDYIYAANTSAGGGVDVIQPLLKAARIDMLRYGGGSYADYYDWQTNTNIQNCVPDDATASFTSACSSSDSLDFSQFSQQARAIGAQSFVTVNYGSGTPALAASWAAQAKSTPGEDVALWEVGNETYGCWEVDNELAGPAANYAGYTPNTYTTVNGTRHHTDVGSL